MPFWHSSAFSWLQVLGTRYVALLMNAPVMSLNLESGITCVNRHVIVFVCRHGFSQAAFVGHSYGTFVLSRVIQQHRHTVQSMVRALNALRACRYWGLHGFCRLPRCMSLFLHCCIPPAVPLVCVQKASDLILICTTPPAVHLWPAWPIRKVEMCSSIFMHDSCGAVKL